MGGAGGLSNYRRLALNLLLYVVTMYAIVKLCFPTYLETSTGGGSDEELPVIIIPGGGLTTEGAVPNYVKARLDRAIELYESSKMHPSSCGYGHCLVTLSAGTPHVPPPRNPKDFPLYEASIGAQYLLAAGIPPSNIFEEKVSLDTLGNAYFLRTIHTDPMGWKSLIVITNKWHMPRVQQIFSTIFRLPQICHKSTVESSSTDSYVVQYEAVSDLLEPTVLELRQTRENQSLQTFVGKTAPMFSCLKDVHNFIFLKHNAYSTERLTSGHKEEKIDPNLLKSY